MKDRLHRYHWSGVCLLAIAFMVSCEHADPLESEGLEPTLASIQENIFNTSCAFAQCHAGSNAQRNLDLSEGQSRSNLVDVDSETNPAFKRVAPGNPDDSYLVMKLEGDPRIMGQRMPMNMSPLSSQEIEVVREWIAAGAE